MKMSDELDALKRRRDCYDFLVEDAKRYFGQWDMCDPVVWAIVRVVQAQNDLAHAIEVDVTYTDSPKAVEAPITERREAIDALVKAFEQEPRGFQ
jgi:hypothetical protein